MTQIIDCPPSERVGSAPAVVDLKAVKAKQQATWASGDYGIVGTTLSIVGESLCEALDLPSEACVLDVACGNGNAALAAARRFCEVTGVDYVPALLDLARERAKGERFDIDFVEGDAEALPFPAETFDVVLSTFGVMFAADQERAAKELLRVVRRGGTIGLANWTPEGFVGQMLKAVGKRVPPPAGVASPVYWGTVPRLEELFRGAQSVRARRREFVFRYLSADHFIDVFRSYYGPTYKAFGTLDATGQEALTNDLHELISDFGRATGGSIAIPSEYLEVVVEK